MHHFIAIDFETANPKRVSACSFGYAEVFDGKIVNTKGYLFKPVGGHSSFQSEIHKIKHEDTCDKPDFNQLWDEIHDIFDAPLVGHSSFDQQVLNALFDHFNWGLNFDYTDTFLIAKKLLPYLRNWKLETLTKYFKLPLLNHHDAVNDAIACAEIYLKLKDLMRSNHVNPKRNSR